MGGVYERGAVERYSRESGTHDLQPVTKEWPKQLIVQDGQQYEIDVPPSEYTLGNPDLPVSRYRYVMDSLFDGLKDKSHPVAIFEGETGCGKTTNVPQAALESGLFDKIYVAQPRIILTRETRKRIVQEMSNALGYDAGHLVGYATSSESELHPDNKIIIGTHGYISQRLANSTDKYLEDSLLIADEYHERETEGDVVVEVAKARQIPTILMSATIDSDSLSKHHCGYDGSTPAPILSMEGRTYPIEEMHMDDATDAAVWALEEGHDILYILPRKADIYSEIGRIGSKAKVKHVALPLHGELSSDEQSRVFQQYPHPKVIVATDIAGTGLTPNVDGVIIPGVGRVMHLKNGVPTLALENLPEAKVRQYMGRCGRDRPGFAIHAPYYKQPHLPNTGSTFATPEILRIRPDSIINRLGRADMTIDGLDLKDKPSGKETERAYSRLRKIGAMAIDNVITEVGRDMSSLPLDPQLARMVIAARGSGEDVQRFMAAAAVVGQLGGVTANVEGGDRWKELSREQRADLLRDLDVYIRALQLSAEEYEQYSILPQRIERATHQIEEICRREGIEYEDFTRVPSDTEREQLLGCMVSGIDELFIRKNASGQYHDIRDPKVGRELFRESAVRSSSKLVAGSPWNLETFTDNGQVRKKYFIKNAMSIDVERLLESAPDRCQLVDRDFEISEDGIILAHKEVFFDNRTTGYHTLREIDSETEQLREFIISGLFQEKLINEHKLPEAARDFRKAIKELRNLEHRSRESLELEDILSLIRVELHNSIPDGVNRLEEIMQYVDGNYIRGFMTNEHRRQILESAPDLLRIKGIDGGNVDLSLSYYDQEVTIHVSDHAALRNIPEFIPQLDGRVVHVRIGDSAKTESFYDLKAKYSANRKDRRKRDTKMSTVGGVALRSTSKRAHLRELAALNQRN